MRILYGLCGVGMGHATRSKIVVEHLRGKGHQVLVAAASKGAADLIRREHPHVVEIVGFMMQCAEGGLDLRATLEGNARNLPGILSRGASAWNEAERFRPEVAITDFDAFSSAFAKAKGIPVFSIDNNLMITRCYHDARLLAPHRDGYRALESFVNVVTPGANHCIVTTFFYPPVRTELARKTTLVPPILRKEVIDAFERPRATEGHVLVYKSPYLDDESVARAIASVPARFVVYGCSKTVRLPSNATARPFDERGFLRDLATARAVVSNGGMSLLGEAISLRKPVYAIPVRGQHEQNLNAAYLERLGFGRQGSVFDGAELREFLMDLPFYEEKLRTLPPHDRNRKLYTTLDRLLARVRVG